MIFAVTAGDEGAVRYKSQAQSKIFPISNDMLIRIDTALIVPVRGIYVA
jgi:hypothetical protein